MLKLISFEKAAVLSAFRSEGITAIPVFGGMTIEVMTTLVVPVLYSLVKELRQKKSA